MAAQKKFDWYVRQTVARCDRISNLERAGALSSDHSARVYEGHFLLIIKKFEAFLEEYILDVSTGKVEHFRINANGRRRRCLPVAPGLSRADARKILILSGSYIDYLPYERTEKIAKTLIKGGGRFCDLDGNHKGVITRSLAIRNNIAHDSSHARDKFISTVLSGFPMPPRKRNPGEFLKSEIRRGVTQLSEYAVNLRAIALYIISG